jgi:hypothetical protein
MRAMAREPERARREEDEAGAAAASADERARILRLQASAGNQAVAKLLRVSKNGQTRLKKKPGGVTLARMEEFQKAGDLSNGDVDAMLRLDDDDLAEAMALDPKSFKSCATETDMSARMSFARAAASRPKTAAVKQTHPRDEVILDVQGKGVLEPDARAFVSKVGVGEAKAWIAGRSNAAVSAAVRLCIAPQGAATLNEIEALLEVDKNLKDYGAGHVLPWAATHGMSTVRTALEETAADRSANYVAAWLELSAKASSSSGFKRLIRLKGRLLDGIAGMAVYQADTQYISAHDYPHSRTGFLRYDFGGGHVELHTHWNVNVRRLVSIHVQENGANTTELNQWPDHFFGEVNAAVVAAHNAATGALAPTGGPLTL